MLDTIISFSIKNKFVVLLLTLVLIIWGVWSATKLQIDAVPDITNNQVQIITACPTLAGQEVERLVTSPIERGLANLPDLEELRSISRFGLSVITVVFDEDVDIYFARQLINEKLKEATRDIPPDIGTPELAPVSTGLGEVYQYIIHPAESAERKYSAMDLRVMQDWIVARQLYGTPGIAEVNSFGGLLKQYEVALDPNKLQAMQITVPEVFTALKKNNENTGGAYIDKKPNAYFIRGVGLINSFDDIKNIVVKSNPNDIPILIKDVAEVRLGSAPRYGAMTYNGEKDAVGGVIMMLKGANSADVVQRIKEKLPVIQKSLPPDVIIEPFLDRTDLVNRAISTVQRNLVEGALIVIFALVLFLGNLRAGLIVASAIPLSMLFALGMMNIFGVSANLMSLGAVDFGLIIDGAVVMVENIVRQLGEKQKHLGRRLTVAERVHTVAAASNQVANPMFFGVLIITIVYIPILALTGIEGKMFHPMAITVMLALGGALVLALTLMPVLCSYLLGGHIREGDNLLVRLLKRAYEPALRLVLAQPWLIVVSTIIWTTLSVLAFRQLGAEFVPKLDEGSHTVMVYRTNSMNLDASLAMELATEKLLLTIPEVDRVFCRLGTSEVATDPMPPSQNDLYIFYRPRAEWRKVNGRRITKDDLAAIIEEEVQKQFPEQSFLFAQPIEMRFNELLEGVRSDLSVKIIGQDYNVMEGLAEKVRAILETIPGLGEVEFEAQGRAPVLEIIVNRDALRRYNLHAADVNRTIATALAGETVGLVYDGDRRREIVVRLKGELRDRIEAIRALPVRVGEHGLVPLEKVAEFRKVSSVDPIVREEGHRRVALMVNLRGRDVEGFVKEARQKITAQVPMPEGYTLEFGGQFKNLQEARLRLLFVVPVTLVLIFLLVFMAFGSLRQALVIYTGVPLAVTGGVLTLWARGMPFSISAAVGFIALSGVAVLNGVVMISYINELREQGRALRDAVIHGALTRLRPVLMTAAVASLGFVPMALATGMGAEVQRPLATVVIGGIISSTFLTLVLLPVLYIYTERWFAPRPDSAETESRK